MGTIVDRGYVMKRGTALVPTFLAFAVVRLLEEHFPTSSTTASPRGMEESLDTVAPARSTASDVLDRFYRGDARARLRRPHAAGERPRRHRRARALVLPDRRPDVVLRVGRYGAYVERDGERANVPVDIAPDELTAAKADELLAAPSGDHPLGTDPRDRS